MNIIYRTRKEIIGAFANNIVRQSPIIPENLTEILNYVNDTLCNWTPQAMDVLDFKDEELLRFVVNKIIFGNKLITDLNKSQAEKDGKTTSQFKFVSRYSVDNPYTDFVDLDALERNILRQIINEQ